MPVVSRAQNRFMHWAEENPQQSGVPLKVSQEFTADQRPGSVKALPKRVKDGKPVKKKKAFGSLAP